MADTQQGGSRDPDTVAFYDTGGVAFARQWHDQVSARLPVFVARCGRGPVCDVGCGTGRDVAALAALGVPVTGVDLSSAMLDLAATAVTAAAVSAPVSLVRADAASLPFRAGVFTGVWSSAGLVHLDDTEMLSALTELVRVLTPGGVAELTVKNREGSLREGMSGRTGPGRRWFRCWAPSEIAALAHRAGFAEVEARTGADTVRADTRWCVLELRR